MDVFFAQITPLLLPLTISIVPVLWFVNVIRDRPHPVREAVDAAPIHVSRWVVWIALVLATLYSTLDVLDRWGVWALVGLVAFPLVAFCVALLVVKMQKKRTEGGTLSEPPLTLGPTAAERSDGL